MGTNGSNTVGNGKFRSSYLNNLAAEYYMAESRTELHQKTLDLVQKNYAGDKQQEMTAEENRQYTASIDGIIVEIDILVRQEQKRLENEKKNGVTGTSEEEIHVIEKIDRISDIISEEELQIMADTYKDFPLVQRKIGKAADSRGFGIDLYPGYDKKIETVLQAATDMKGFIQSRDFGLTPAIYIEVQLGEADAVLSPVVKEEDEA